MKTRWRCDRCGADGVLDIPRGRDALTGSRMVMAEHLRLRRREPGSRAQRCTGDVWTVRIILRSTKSATR